VIASTNRASGLSKFVHKMLENEGELLSVNGRALALRELSLASLSIGVSTGLLRIDHDVARVYSLETSGKPMVAEGVKQMERCAERLGLWFSQLPEERIFSMLRMAY
jgi:hypothetical protein